jgi:hypothetical protein
VILDQNLRRSSVVPERVIRQLADKCEPPSLAESDGLRMVDRIALGSRG